MLSPCDRKESDTTGDSTTTTAMHIYRKYGGFFTAELPGKPPVYC